MKTKRSLTINNSLVHGICNCSCVTCAINKPSFKGPKVYQAEEVTRKLAERVIEAAEEGIHIRSIGNSGDGEPTLHPEFENRMAIFGDMIKNWKNTRVPAPMICVVTNGQNLSKPGIIDTLRKNKIGLKVSFPTIIPEHYGYIMTGDSKCGREMLDNLLPSIDKLMFYSARKEITSLEFHISPPYGEYVGLDFPLTVDYLSKRAKENGLSEIVLTLFPYYSNRVGTVNDAKTKISSYEDCFRKHNKKYINDVKINIQLPQKYFYPRFWDYLDVLYAYSYPCLWYAKIYLSPFGDSCCCNDLNITEPRGNILTHSIREIKELRESKRPSEICANCNQTLEKLLKSKVLMTYHSVALMKTKLFSEKIKK